MYKRILVPLDGSPLAEQVLPYAHLIAHGLGARVELLRVVEPVSPLVSATDSGVNLEQIAASMQAQAHDYLEGVAVGLKLDRLSVTCRVSDGDPASVIVAEAEKVPETLIALSTRGRSGITRWMTGSVMDKVLHATTSPLLIVRPVEHGAAQKEVKLTSVIVPLDGSELAEQILPHVVALAKALKLHIHLVRVTPTSAYYYQYMDLPMGGSYPDLSKDVDADAIGYLEKMGQKLRLDGVPSVDEQLLHGQPAGVIVDLAQKVSDNLVAMTTHGRSGLGRWILGSVADRVARYSGDPVLVIRATAT